MIKHLENRAKADRFGATYLALCSVFNGSVLSERLSEFNVELADLFGKLSTPPASRSQVWLCVDRRDPDLQPREASALAGVNIRFDFLRPRELPEYHSIRLGITLLRPGDCDLLMPGWPWFRKWLLEETLKGWRDALLAKSDAQLISNLANTRAWIYGQPDQIFGYDAFGNPVVVDDHLPGPEDAYALFSEYNLDEEEDDGDETAEENEEEEQ